MAEREDLLAGWEIVTRNTRADQGEQAYVEREVAELRTELAELGVPVTREVLTAYLHGLGQALNHITAETGYLPHNPHDWEVTRPAAVVELAREIDGSRAA